MRHTEPGKPCFNPLTYDQTAMFIKFL